MNYMKISRASIQPVIINGMKTLKPNVFSLQKGRVPGVFENGFASESDCIQESPPGVSFYMEVKARLDHRIRR
jgi:hypothetical protein